MGLLTDKSLCIDNKTFKNMLGRKNAYIATNKKAPKIVYTDFNSKKDWIAIQNFFDMEKRWNSWIKEKETEPNCVFIGTPLNPPNLQTGNVYVVRYLKDWNIRQETPYFCGPNIIQNIWYTIFGVIPKEQDIGKIAGTQNNLNGTIHEGLNKALNWLANRDNKKIDIKWEYFSDIGWKGIEDIYKDSNKAIGFHTFYRLKWGHYECGYFINRNTETIGIINSLGNKDEYGNYLGYFEKRSFKDMQSYIRVISHPNCLIVTKR